MHLITDLTYAWVDPRIDFEAGRREHERHAARRPAAGPALSHARRFPSADQAKQGWLKLSPINRRRLDSFEANKRGWWSFWIFLTLFVLSLFAEFIANDRPLIVRYKGETLFPVAVNYPEEKFGGFLATTDYRDPTIAKEISANGWAIWPPIRYSYRTHNLDLPVPAPAPPTWMLRDEQCKADRGANRRHDLPRPRMELARHRRPGPRRGRAADLRLPHLGAVRADPRLDLLGDRHRRRRDPGLFRRLDRPDLPARHRDLDLDPRALPPDHRRGIITPGFFVLLGILLLFSWVALVGVVRAEFLRARNFEYVRAARALGLSNRAIMVKHLLPNAMVATLTFLPFILNGSITTLTSLDFLGFGLPPGSPSLGELLAQGKVRTCRRPGSDSPASL